MLPSPHIVRLRLQRNLLVLLAISVASTAAAWAWWEFDVLGIAGSELGAYDTGLSTFTNKAWFPFGKKGQSKDVVIVAIDDDSLFKVKSNEGLRQNYGAWPYSRNVWAHVFSYLADRGARAVVFDAVVDEPHPDQAGDEFMAQVVKDQQLPVYLGFSFLPDLAPLPKVEAKNRPLPQRVVAPPPAAPAPAPADAGEETFPEETFPGGDEAFPDEGTGPDDAAKAEALRAQAALALAFPVEAKGLELPKVEPDVDRDGKEHPRFPSPPLPSLLDAVPGFGVVDAETDEDGKMRRTRFAYTDGANTYVTLPVAVAADLLGADRVVLEPGALRLGSHVVPINGDGTAELDYGGTLHERFRTVRLHDVLNDYWRGVQKKEKGEAFTWNVPDDVFAGKVVFLAGFAMATADQKPTPFERITPGVVKHATELSNLLDGRFITLAPFWVSLLLAFAISFFSVALVLVVQSPVADLGWPLVTFFLFFGVTGSILVATHVHVLSAMPSMAGTFASVATTAFNNFLARQDRQRMKELFRAYMEADLVDIMVEQRELPKLEGENMVVTAFFSDIEGFSSVSEAYRDSPRSLIKLLNRYLSAVTPVITAQGACIDKYIGDAVVALFGAPVRYDDHPLRACRAALDVLAAVNALNKQLAVEGLPVLRTRIGLNTGTMMVGNIGTEQLLDFTAIGDGMNLAARLEGANKEYGTRIMMGAATWEQVQAEVEARELDLVRVAGKKLAVPIYELLAPKGGLTETQHKVLSLYAQGLALYRKREFTSAKARFEAALSLDDHDGPSRTMSRRCDELQKDPPPPDWDGATDLAK